MENRKLKKEVVYGIYVGIALIILSVIYYADLSNRSFEESKPNDDYTYVSKLFNSGVQSVVQTTSAPTLVRPYTAGEVKIIKSFYDYKGEEESQKNSIINYETTYIQNNGIIYGGINETFDVVCVLDGEVTSVKDDNLLGKTVTIKHESNIITTYQSLGEVTVKEGDQISQGTVIGTAGESNLEKDLGKHVLFEMNVEGKYINPENYYNKQISEIKNN